MASKAAGVASTRSRSLSLKVMLAISPIQNEGSFIASSRVLAIWPLATLSSSSVGPSAAKASNISVILATSASALPGWVGALDRKSPKPG